MVFNYFSCFSSIFQIEPMSHKAFRYRQESFNKKLCPDFRVKRKVWSLKSYSSSKQECVALLSHCKIIINNVCRITATYKNNILYMYRYTVTCTVHTMIPIQFLVLLSGVKYYFRKLPILHRGSIVISCGF